MEYFTGITTNSKLIPEPLYFGNSRVFFKNVTGRPNKTFMEGCLTIEIFIISQNEVDFLRILDLLFSSLAVISHQPFFDKNDVLYDILQISKHQASRYMGVYIPNEVLPACYMAQKALSQSSLEVSILKYNLAHDNYSIDMMLYDPSINEPEFLFLPSNQIRIASAITTLYSILEELNMNIKASSDNPSTINKGENWNPVVYQSLHERCSIYGIDIDQRISWIHRGEPNRPLKKCIDSSDICEWSNGKDIRDYNIKISDAILEISFMRSKLASHGITSRIDMLNEKDLVNTSHLARYILLKIADIEL